MKRKVKIICTIGPSSQGPRALKNMASEGMDIVRINFSHGHHELHQGFIDMIRSVNRQSGYGIRILQDLEGYRMRVGQLTAPVMLQEGQDVIMVKGGRQAGGAIPLECESTIDGIKPGMNVFINDGMILLKVLECAHQTLCLRVLHGGILQSRKGVNIPQLKLPANVLTAKDKRDIKFGIRNKMDYVAQSFVRNARDIAQVVSLIKPHLPECKIIAKIEDQEGINHVDEILEACDGIMVARGDLGVSLPMWQVPMVQKDIINRCNKKGKMVITATQMLESMIVLPRPTRAEVSDVANAILDGTNAVMLSAETAVGLFPVESVRMLREIIHFTENAQDNEKLAASQLTG